MADRHAIKPLFLYACWCAWSLPVPPVPTPLSLATGSPDGLMTMASQRGAGGKIEIKAADDFIPTQATLITGGALPDYFWAAVSRSRTFKVLPSSSTACFPEIRRSHPAATFVNSPSHLWGCLSP